MNSSNFSRTSSNGSMDNILLSPSSSNVNTDASHTTEEEEEEEEDEVDDEHELEGGGSDRSVSTYKEKRREAHTQAEQKRRDAIKRGYEDLQSLVPKCQQQDSVSSYKLSKASILQRSIEYIQLLQKNNKDLDETRRSLKKEKIALGIMKTNYEQIVRNQQIQSGSNGLTGPNGLNGSNGGRVSEEVKMQVFTAICDSLFISFDQMVMTGNFSQLTACVFSWLEESCKPQSMTDMTRSILCQLMDSYPPPRNSN